MAFLGQVHPKRPAVFNENKYAFLRAYRKGGSAGDLTGAAAGAPVCAYVRHVLYFVHEGPRGRQGAMKSRREVVLLVRDKVRMLHYALGTEDAYCAWVGRYYDFCKGLPAHHAPEHKMESFLTNLAVVERLSARTQNQAFAAILFLYRHVLGKPLSGIDALRAKQPKTERVSPSREQVRLFRTAVEDTVATPARLLVDLLYGCGLRVTEPLELRVKDVLWGEGDAGQLLLRGAKGGKDRRVPVPRLCITPLRRQVEFARNVWAWDRANAPGVGVTLPHALAAKYPKSPFQWQWFWIFPAQNHCTDPRDGKRVRFHILHDNVQRSVQKAAAKVGLDGLITPHVLRHAYATHSREPIESLRQLLGHSSIETTAGYMHPVVDRASNPLDDLLKQGVT
jgi:integrase